LFADFVVANLFQGEVVLDSCAFAVDVARVAVVGAVVGTVENIAVFAVKKIASIAVVAVVLVIAKKFAVAVAAAAAAVDGSGRLRCCGPRNFYCCRIRRGSGLPSAWSSWNTDDG